MLIYKHISAVVALTIYLYQRNSPSGLNYVNKKGVFSFGIIWSALKQIIIIAGISIVFSLGLKGTGIRIEYFIFNWMFWFHFSEIARALIDIHIPPHIRKNSDIYFTHFYVANFVKVVSQFFVIGIIISLTLMLFGFKLSLPHLLIAFSLNSIFALSYSIVVAQIIHKKTFLIELHDFFLQGLLFVSSIIIPISILPNFVIDILVWNPLVHINEYIKEPITGIYLGYIDIYYTVKTTALIFMLVIPLIYIFETQYRRGDR